MTTEGEARRRLIPRSIRWGGRNALALAAQWEGFTRYTPSPKHLTFLLAFLLFMWNLENLLLGAENVFFFYLYLIIYMATIDNLIKCADVVEKKTNPVGIGI